MSERQLANYKLVRFGWVLYLVGTTSRTVSTSSSTSTGTRESTL